jgi:hypothetical protein
MHADLEVNAVVEEPSQPLASGQLAAFVLAPDALLAAHFPDLFAPRLEILDRVFHLHVVSSGFTADAPGFLAACAATRALAGARMSADALGLLATRALAGARMSADALGLLATRALAGARMSADALISTSSPSRLALL